MSFHRALSLKFNLHVSVELRILKNASNMAELDHITSIKRFMTTRVTAVTEWQGRALHTCEGNFNMTIGCIIQCVRKVTVDLRKVFEVTATSVYKDLKPFNFIRKHFLQICV
jgi:hypothetical protein